jgi:hypothetical protein
MNGVSDWVKRPCVTGRDESTDRPQPLEKQIRLTMANKDNGLCFRLVNRRVLWRIGFLPFLVIAKDQVLKSVDKQRQLPFGSHRVQ